MLCLLVLVYSYASVIKIFFWLFLILIVPTFFWSSTHLVNMPLMFPSGHWEKCCSVQWYSTRDLPKGGSRFINHPDSVLLAESPASLYQIFPSCSSTRRWWATLWDVCLKAPYATCTWRGGVGISETRRLIFYLVVHNAARSPKQSLKQNPNT